MQRWQGVRTIQYARVSNRGRIIMRYEKFKLNTFGLIMISLAVFYLAPGCSNDPTGVDNYELSWVQTRGPYRGFVPTISINSQGHVYAGVWRKGGYHSNGDGLFRSTDNCNSWRIVDAEAGTSFAVYTTSINSKGHVFVFNFGTMQAGSGVYRSLDNGTSWTPVWEQTDLQVGSFTLNRADHIFAVAFSDTDSSEIFRSRDNGDNWETITDYNATSLVVDSQGNLFSGAYDGHVYRSTDNGDSWALIYNSPVDAPLILLAINKHDHIFAMIPDEGMFRSIDNAASWVHIGNDFDNAYIFHLEINKEGDIYAGIDSRFYRSMDNGDTWTKLDSNVLNSMVWSIAFGPDGQIYAGTGSDGIIRSTDNGNSWATVGAPIAEVRSLVVNPSDHIFAETDFGLFRSLDGDNSWDKLEFDGSIQAISANGILYANNGGLWRSEDNGDSWTMVNPLTSGNLAINSEGYIYGTTGSGVMRSIDNGETWETPANAGLVLADAIICDVAIDVNDNIYLSTSEIIVPPPPPDEAAGVLYSPSTDSGGTFGVFYSTDDGDSWTFIGGPETGGGKLTIDKHGHIFSVGDIFSEVGSIYRGSNTGEEWICVNCTVPTFCIAINSAGTVYAATYEGIRYSTDNGDNWKWLNNGLKTSTIKSLAIDSNDVVFAGSAFSGIYRLD